jgi:lipopolysaccharide biosynthesis protein
MYLCRSRNLLSWKEGSAGLVLRRPVEGFHPLIYASDNPLFRDSDRVDPFVHYLQNGRPNGRWTHTVFNPDNAAVPGAVTLRAAVHAHFHYPELLPDFLKRLEINKARIDLYLTTGSDKNADALGKVLSEFGRNDAHVRVTPNRGRDIGPFLTALKDELSLYDVVGHLHGKRSLHGGSDLGERWRDFLWEHLVGSRFAMADMILSQFMQNERLGVVFPEEPHLFGWNDNTDIAEELARRMGISTPLPNHFDFPMGTMFWARTAALRPLFDLGLGWDDYPDEPVPYDGTILHALERLVPFAAQHAGYGYATTYVKGSTR